MYIQVEGGLCSTLETCFCPPTKLTWHRFQSKMKVSIKDFSSVSVILWTDESLYFVVGLFVSKSAVWKVVSSRRRPSCFLRRPNFPFLLFSQIMSPSSCGPASFLHHHNHHPRHLESMKIRAWCPYVQLFPTNPVWGQHRLWLNQTKSNHQIISRLAIFIAPLLCSFLSSPYLHPQKDGPKTSFDMWISFPIVHIHIKYDILCEAQHYCFMQLFSLDRCCFVRVA